MRVALTGETGFVDGPLVAALAMEVPQT